MAAATKKKGQRAKKLVIVESPTKAKTVGKFLGSSYMVRPSVGHIRDLPANRLGVEIESDFRPRYVIPEINGHTRNLKASAEYLAANKVELMAGLSAAIAAKVQGNKVAEAAMKAAALSDVPQATSANDPSE